MLLVKKKDCNSGRVYNQLNGAVYFRGREGVTLNSMVPLTLGGKGNEGDIEANGAVDFGERVRGMRVTFNPPMPLTLGERGGLRVTLNPTVLLTLGTKGV